MDGKWVNAVNENFGGEKNFVLGPYSEAYGLGTYGKEEYDTIYRSAKAMVKVLTVSFLFCFFLIIFSDADHLNNTTVKIADILFLLTVQKPELFFQNI